VKLSPEAATVLQSAACAVAESAQTIAAVAKPNFMDCIAPSKKDLSRTLVEGMALAKERIVASRIHSHSLFVFMAELARFLRQRRNLASLPLFARKARASPEARFGAPAHLSACLECKFSSYAGPTLGHD
jgi:hypothetical protein